MLTCTAPSVSFHICSDSRRAVSHCSRVEYRFASAWGVTLPDLAFHSLDPNVADWDSAIRRFVYSGVYRLDESNVPVPDLRSVDDYRASAGDEPDGHAQQRERQRPEQEQPGDLQPRPHVSVKQPHREGGQIQYRAEADPALLVARADLHVPHPVRVVPAPLDRRPERRGPEGGAAVDVGRRHLLVGSL